MDTVSDSLLGEEARRKERGDFFNPEANVVEDRGRTEFRGRSMSRNSHKSRGRSKSRLKITCYYCGKIGHKKIECRSFKRDQKAGNVKPDQISPAKKQEEKSTTAVVSKEDLLYFVGEDNILNIACDDSSWIIDSGASFHVTPHERFFSSYQNGDFGTVQMGNEDRSKIVGIGDIILTTSTGSKLILKDVRHVPAMRLNLISAGKLDNDGLMNYFGEGKWKLTKGSLVMARGKKEGSLYVMQAKPCKGEVNITTNDAEDHEPVLEQSNQETHDKPGQRDIITTNDAEDHEPVLEQSNQETHDEPVQEDSQSSSSTTLELRRSLRDRRPSTRYNKEEYVMLTNEGEPQRRDAILA